VDAASGRSGATSRAPTPEAPDQRQGGQRRATVEERRAHTAQRAIQKLAYDAMNDGGARLGTERAEGGRDRRAGGPVLPIPEVQMARPVDDRAPGFGAAVVQRVTDDDASGSLPIDHQERAPRRVVDQVAILRRPIDVDRGPAARVAGTVRGARQAAHRVPDRCDVREVEVLRKRRSGLRRVAAPQIVDDAGDLSEQTSAVQTIHSEALGNGEHHLPVRHGREERRVGPPRPDGPLPTERAATPGSAEHTVDSGADHHRSVARRAVSTQRPRDARLTMLAAVGRFRKRAARNWLERPLQNASALGLFAVINSLGLQVPKRPNRRIQSETEECEREVHCS